MTDLSAISDYDLVALYENGAAGSFDALLARHPPYVYSYILCLVKDEDLSFKEIAQQTGVSINTALGRMRYALINLRKLIGKKQFSLVG